MSNLKILTITKDHLNTVGKRATKKIACILRYVVFERALLIKTCKFKLNVKKKVQQTTTKFPGIFSSVNICELGSILSEIISKLYVLMISEEREVNQAVLKSHI